MSSHPKLALVGVVIGIIPIALGIVALVTHKWIEVDYANMLGNDTVTYSLFRRSGQIPLASPSNASSITLSDSFRTPQGLEIAGVGAVGLGIIVAVVIFALARNRWIKFLPQILLIGGPAVILIGFLLYAKYLIEDFGQQFKMKVHLGYSMILMVIACITGFVAAVYFAFLAGYTYHRSRKYKKILTPDPDILRF